MRRILSTFAILSALVAVVVAQGTVMPMPKPQFFDNFGNVCSGCQLYTYAAGTTTPQTTWSDSALTVPNANPIVLDSAGRATVYLSTGTAYKFVLASSGGGTIWSVDNVTSVPASVNSNAGLIETSVYTFGGTSLFGTANTSFPSGATGDKCAPNTGIWSIDSVNLTATYALEATLAVDNGSNTVSLEFVNLTDASDTPLVTITSTSTTGARVRSGSISFAASGSAKSYAVKLKTSAGYGYAWGIRIVRTS